MYRIICYEKADTEYRQKQISFSRRTVRRI